jgi:hypothetical protein
MGEITASNGVGGQCLYLMMTSQSPAAYSLYGCVTPSGVSGGAFGYLPSAFCQSQQDGACVPAGTAIDKSQNLYYVDPVNEKLVECSASSNYQSCSNLQAGSVLAGSEPTGLYLKGSTIYVSGWSGTCSGKVWKGNAASLSLYKTYGDQLDSVALSNKNPSKATHVYVGASGTCTGTAGVLDITDGTFLPTPLSSSVNIYGLDSKLQFATTFSGVYSTTDIG